MTREVKVYWAVKYSGDTWVFRVGPVQGRADKKLRHLFATQREALAVAAQIVYPPVILVRVTKKPKAPPPLKVGDAVMVRGKVLALGERLTAKVEALGRSDGASTVVWVWLEEVVREKAT